MGMIAGPVVALLVVLVLAYGNGANDNFKGVATLLGSGTTSYRGALVWGTVTTLSGSLAALVLSRGLLRSFSGRDLVPDAVAGSPAFLTIVALAAAGTVFLATCLSLPVSTTHALTGALLGAGLVRAGGELRLAALGTGFLLPLLLSPLVAMALTSAIYPFLRWSRGRLGVDSTTCVCAEQTWIPGANLAASATATASRLHLSVCPAREERALVSVNARQVLGVAHFATAGVVSFARGLNDTPKIVALLATAPLMAPPATFVLVGLVMAVGALLQARRVATTMAHRVTSMNHGQGFSANLVTATLVLAASGFGLPVSTTHVSCGALFGLGAVTGQGRWGTVAHILLAWTFTLPVAAGLAAAAAAVWIQ